MFDYETFTAADGYSVSRNFGLNCLSEGVLTDGFFASVYFSNQAFAIQFKQKCQL